MPTEEVAEVARARGPHVRLVRPGPGSGGPALGPDRRGRGQVVEAKLSNWASDLALAAFCILAPASYLGLELYAGFSPARSQAFLVRFRTRMNTHTEQVIIAGSLLLGFWLIAKSIYLIIT